MNVDCDYDTMPSSSGSTSSTKIMPLIKEDAIMEINTKAKVMELLDNLENHVETMRKDAVRLEEEKDNILASLDAVKVLPALNELSGLEKDEAFRYLDRIVERCLTVDVKIYTQRDKSQEDALYQVNLFIDHLVVSIKGDPDQAKTRCISYMNACSSQTCGISDKKFESALLGCTIDDQKRVKKRLHGLLHYFEKLAIIEEIKESNRM